MHALTELAKQTPNAAFGVIHHPFPANRLFEERARQPGSRYHVVGFETGQDRHIVLAVDEEDELDDRRLCGRFLRCAEVQVRRNRQEMLTNLKGDSPSGIERRNQSYAALP